MSNPITKPKFKQYPNHVECLICKKTFKYLSNYYTHHRKIHKGDNNNDYTNICDGKYKYSCNMCVKKFKTLNGFRNHYNENHKCNSKKYTLVVDNSCTKYKCIICFKIYSYKSGLYSHYNKLHNNVNKSLTKSEQKNEDLNDVESVKKELEELKKKYDVLVDNQNKILKDNKRGTKIINNNTTNNNITINIVSHGDEKLDKLDVKYFIKAFNNSLLAIPKFLELVHFNDEFPEYRNIYIPNDRKNVVKVYKNGYWILVSKDLLIDKIFTDKSELLEDKYHDVCERLNDFTKKRFTRFIENKDIKSDYIKSHISDTLYNNKDMVKG